MAFAVTAARAGFIGDGVRAYAVRSIAVTGASGFIGGATVRSAAAVDCQVDRVPPATFGDPAAGTRWLTRTSSFTSPRRRAVRPRPLNPAADFHANVTPIAPSVGRVP